MMKLVKILLVTVAVIVVLIGAAVLLAPRFIDPNDFKPQIATAVRDATGRELTIEGDIELTVFPWLGADIGQLSLGPPPGTAAAPSAESTAANEPAFLSAERTQVRVKLLPLLLSRRLEMDTVTLQGLTINLARNKEGRGNWEDLLASKAGESREASSEAPLATLALGGVKATDATLRFDDQMTSSRYAITKLDLTTGPVNLDALGEPVELAASFQIAGESPAFAEPLAGQVEVTGTLAYQSEPELIGAEGLRLRVDLTGGPSERLAASLSGPLEVGIKTQRVRSPKLSLNIETLQVAGITVKADIAGALDLDPVGAERLTLTAFSAAGALGGPALAQGSTQFRSSGDASVDFKAALIRLTDAKLALTELNAFGLKGTLTAGGQVEGLVDEQRYGIRGLNLEGNLTEAAGLRGRIPFTASGDAEVALAADRITVTGLKLSSPSFDLPQASGALTVVAATLTGQPSRSTYTLGELAVELKAKGKAELTGEVAARARGDLQVSGTERLRSERLTVEVSSFDFGGNQGSLTGRSRAELDLGKGQLILTGLSAEGKLKGKALAGGKASLKTDASRVDYQLQSKSFNVEQLALALPDLDYAGIQGALEAKGTIVGNPSSNTYSAKRLRVQGKLSGDPIPGGPLPVDVIADATVNLAKNTARLTGLAGRVAELTINGDVDVSGLGGALALVGDAELGSQNPRALLVRAGLGKVATRNPKALSQVKARAKFNATQSSVALTDLDAELDQSTLRGRLSFAQAETPRVTFNLVMNGIDADRYLAPEGSGSPKTKDAPPGALPIAALTQLDLDGKLKIGNLKINNMRMSNVQLTAKAKDKQLSLAPVQANLYGGKFDGQMSIDARQAVPLVTTRAAVQGIQAGPLLTDLNGEARLTGQADLDVDLSSSGTSDETIRRNASGAANFVFRDGTIKGINIVQRICSQLSGLGVVTAPAAASGEETKFSALTGTAKIVRGVASNEDLSVTSPFLRVAGAGSADLVTEAINYSLTSYLVDSCEGQGRAMAQNLLNIPIPIQVGGTFSRPSWKFDFGRLLQGIASREIEKQGTRILEKALGRSVKPAAPAESAPAAPGSGTGSGTGSGSGSGSGAPPGGTRPEDVLKDVLKGILGR